MIFQTALQGRYSYLSRVHFLSDLNVDDHLDDTLVFRYMQYDDLKLSLKGRNFAFMTPENWEDKLEQRYWKTNYSEVNSSFVLPEFACLCVTSENHEDSAASWKLYRREIQDRKESDYDNNLVRLSLNFEKLLIALNDWANANESQIYLSAIDYSFSKTQIINDIPKNEELFPQNFDIENYFKLLCFKRLDYSFEREIRIFALKPLTAKLNEKILLLEPFDLSSCVTGILISPAKKNYQKVLTAEVMKSEIGAMLTCSNNIKTCRLYDDCSKPKIEKGTGGK